MEANKMMGCDATRRDSTRSFTAIHEDAPRAESLELHGGVSVFERGGNGKWWLREWGRSGRATAVGGRLMEEILKRPRDMMLYKI